MKLKKNITWQNVYRLKTMMVFVFFVLLSIMACNNLRNKNETPDLSVLQKDSIDSSINLLIVKGQPFLSERNDSCAILLDSALSMAFESGNYSSAGRAAKLLSDYYYNKSDFKQTAYYTGVAIDL